jgi:hypothetical protein
MSETTPVFASDGVSKRLLTFRSCQFGKGWSLTTTSLFFCIGFYFALLATFLPNSYTKTYERIPKQVFQFQTAISLKTHAADNSQYFNT